MGQATPSVSLVIPGRNASQTVGACLSAVVPLMGRDGLCEIIFIDDGSNDATAQMVAKYPVRYVRGAGAGPGSARNIGWRLATGELIWFIDADCVAEPDALGLLVAEFTSPRVAGAGGSYGNMSPGSLLATLIHEEIVERHHRMTHDVNFLATFNVVYRKTVLRALGGFDEAFLKAQDAELAFRIIDAGYQLRFVKTSRVLHFHPISLTKYLDTQRHQGFWRVLLYQRYPAAARGDSYSGIVDHVQPLAALLLIATLPFLVWPAGRLAGAIAAVALLATTIPMTLRLMGRTGRVGFVMFAPMAALRAVARAVGLVAGAIEASRRRLRAPEAVA